MSLSEGSSAMTFLDEFQSAMDEAVVSGLIIPDQKLMVLLLGTLSESWRSISIRSNQFPTHFFLTHWQYPPRRHFAYPQRF